MSGNFSGHSYYSNSSQGALSSFRLGESPMSSAYSDVRGSPHSHSSGRGWQYRGGSPSPGWSGGRGRGGFHNKGYGLGRQLDSFYVKSMVKDPWRKLKPVIGNILVPLSGPQSWLPKSITTKKVKVAENAIDIKPKQNLAEFLAVAFEETISNEQEGEGSIVPYTNDQSGRAG
ncbi:uncharacterized protein LOC110038627 [Phalaenopsis equestris]|uniref:uncharacterized protein LOC110038627 n=1 Tax=Phalaenopsis equestris TaxID=78828 RepID=UPI0009E56CD2|nr:uncharacterized protein LOC110038627 [Phalaenopsis equestris]